MNGYIKIKGTLREVVNDKNLTLEELCKNICTHKQIEIDGHSKNYVELLLNNTTDEYIVLGGKLFNFWDLEEFDPFEEYLNLIELYDGIYRFETVFYDDGYTSLDEMIQEEFEKTLSKGVNTYDKQ